MRRYEGLVRATARRLAPYVETELDDIEQALRLAVWSGLKAYDATRSTMDESHFVFMVVKNRSKDVIKRRRYPVDSMELVAPSGRESPQRDAFDARYMASSEDDVYGAVGDDLALPSTLTEDERRMIGLLYCGYGQQEAGAEVGLVGRQAERAMKAIRLKLADWRPTSDEDPPEIVEIEPQAA